jgi:hypothetical protein
MEWQTIETAPKDGTRILLFDGADMYVAAWEDSSMSINETKNWVYAVVSTDWNYYEVVYNPTHWMPLPEFPISK